MTDRETAIENILADFDKESAVRMMADRIDGLVIELREKEREVRRLRKLEKEVERLRELGEDMAGDILRGVSAVESARRFLRARKREEQRIPSVSTQRRIPGTNLPAVDDD